MFSLIAMNFELITLSPQYAQFGSQHYTDIVREGGEKERKGEEKNGEEKEREERRKQKRRKEKGKRRRGEEENTSAGGRK